MLHKLAEELLFPRLDRFRYEEHFSTGSSTSNNVRVYKHRTAEDSSDMSADRHFDFAILSSSKFADSPKTSKIYFGTSTLDFHMNGACNSLTLYDMWQPKYSSSLEKSSENDVRRQMDPGGGPDVLGWQTVPLVYLSSVQYEGRRNLQSRSAVL